MSRASFKKPNFCVFSSFFLRWLSASFKKGGFDVLSAEAGAESATSHPLSSLYWLSHWEEVRTFYCINIPSTV
ncbi:MAG: hypothetical protein COU25_00365 [Candidatus Levybacteria bacterium CG10_big_fil_rev_8_21_14_0_10_35_13]|nr:MAG: hypothetical protein COU25_00365 [Candidatus Levybacteria bacterium CG10_big_fil_rev_8_21_14_0_10_35_13]